MKIDYIGHAHPFTSAALPFRGLIQQPLSHVYEQHPQDPPQLLSYREPKPFAPWQQFILFINTLKSLLANKNELISSREVLLRVLKPIFVNPIALAYQQCPDDAHKKAFLNTQIEAIRQSIQAAIDDMVVSAESPLNTANLMSHPL